jgi:hypothetical protein
MLIWYGVLMNTGALSFRSEMVTSSGIVFLFDVDSTVHVS